LERLGKGDYYNYSDEKANKLSCSGHVLRNDKNEWVKNAWIMKWKV